VPGGGHREYPAGYGKLIGPGTSVDFKMHYHKEAGSGTGVWDRSMVALWFHPDGQPVYHPVSTGVVGNWDFEIPPGAEAWRIGSSLFFGEDSVILSLVPHMHFRGVRAQFAAFYPDGTSELLLEVNFDFYWQSSYDFKEPRKMPAGTRVDFTAYYDNSANSPYNPDPGVPIRFGDRSTDEMSLVFVTWTPAARRNLGQRPARVNGGGQ
jgi:hypothetical protein